MNIKMMKKLIKKVLISLLLLLLFIYLSFYCYRSYILKDIDIATIVKKERKIKVKNNIYCVYNIHDYPLLLMSTDNGITWKEKNVRGFMNIVPRFECLQANDIFKDVISVQDTLFIIEKDIHASWDSNSGFYKYFYSTNNGKSWKKYYNFYTSLRKTYLGGTDLKDKPNSYDIYYEKRNYQLPLKQDKTEIIK